MRGITKRFPGVVALHNVSLHVDRREVVAVIGENGAGKSTLMKILGGVYQPDEGTITIEGRPVAIRSVGDAQRLGIAFIHQELNVLPNLDVAANVFLGREPVRGGPLRLVDQATIHRNAQALLDRLGLNVSSRTLLGNLSLAQQQMVEIAKALSQEARILIMDEPTSSLTLRETERLLEVVQELRAQGVSVIYISHRLGEIERIADRVVGLRDGANAGRSGKTPDQARDDGQTDGRARSRPIVRPRRSPRRRVGGARERHGRSVFRGAQPAHAPLSRTQRLVPCPARRDRRHGRAGRRGPLRGRPGHLRRGRAARRRDFAGRQAGPHS
jgi:ABC-type sugar transport system ATPase subunit